MLASREWGATTGAIAPSTSRPPGWVTTRATGRAPRSPHSLPTAPAANSGTVGWRRLRSLPPRCSQRSLSRSPGRCSERKSKALAPEGPGDDCQTVAAAPSLKRQALMITPGSSSR